MRVWAEAWDVFRRAPSRVGRGGRAAVDFVVCFGLGGFLSDFFSFLMRQGRENEATEAVFYLQAKKPLHIGVRTGCHYLVCLLCVRVCSIRRFY